MLEGAGHPLGFILGDAVASRGIAPPSDGRAYLRRYRTGVSFGHAEHRHDPKSGVERRCSVALVNRECMDARLHVRRHRIQIIGRREPPAIRLTEKAVIAKMIVGIGNQHIEYDSAPELTQVLVHLRSLAPQELGNLEIAAHLVIGRIERGERRDVWDAPACPPVEATGHQDGPLQYELQPEKRYLDTRGFGDCHSHRLPARHRPVVVPARKLGDQQVTVIVADRRFRASAAERRPRGQDQLQVLVRLCVVDDTVGGGQQTGEVDERWHRPAGRAEELAAARVLDA